MSKQPIAFCQKSTTEAGAGWQEAFRIPAPAKNDAHDRIMIFETTDGDGVFDKNTGLHG